MTNYRRTKIAGASYFFTVNCAQRHGSALLTEHIDLLRQVVRKVKSDHPFTIDAMVVLPEHLHCIWTLPQRDADYKTRWSLIKSGFSRQFLLAKDALKVASKEANGGSGNVVIGSI